MNKHLKTISLILSIIFIPYLIGYNVMCFLSENTNKCADFYWLLDWLFGWGIIIILFIIIASYYEIYKFINKN